MTEKQEKRIQDKIKNNGGVLGAKGDFTKGILITGEGCGMLLQICT